MKAQKIVGLALAPLAVSALLGLGCTRYEQRPVPILAPSAYPNSTQVFGVVVGGRIYADKAAATEAFGFDIVSAGVLPVQLAFDNATQNTVEIVPSQTFLVDPAQQMWNILEQNVAYRRLEESTEWGKLASEAGKGSVLGAAAGALVGAAVGIVTGENVLVAGGKGAAVGAAGGAVLGGAKGLSEPDTKQAIREDLRSRSLENKPIPPQAISHGVLYFPAEAASARTLRLQVRNAATGEVATATLGF